MIISECAQELLEQLWIAVEEEGQSGLAVAAGQGGEELERAALVAVDHGRLRLTPDGRREAAGAIRRHRLAERLLADVLATEDLMLEEHACRLEHALVAGLDDSICTLLGHPPFCPHGKPIPRGECCRQMRDSVPRLIMPLADLRPGQEGHVAYIQMAHPGRLQKLMAMGLLPGVPLRLIRRSPSFVLEAGQSQFAVDEQIAGSIYVRVGSRE